MMITVVTKPQEIDPKTRRGLILISKIIQTLSNGVVFGKKEEYMIPMNSFINENLENVHYVLDKVSTFIPDIHSKEIEQLPPLPDDEYENVIKRLHAQLFVSMNKIISTMRQQNLSNEFIQHFNSVLLRYGPPAIKISVETKPNNPPSSSNLAANENNGTSSTVSNGSSSNLVNSTEDLNKLESKKSMEKKQKEEKKIQDKKMRDERKMKEKDKSKERKKPEFPLPEGSVLSEAFILRKTKGNFNTIQWIKKYYAIYSISTKIYVANSPEDLRENRFLGFIDLYPAFSTTLVGKSKNPSGWEIRLVTAQEHNLIFLTENEMRSWVSVLDRRLNEIVLPEQALKRKEDLIKSMELKLERYNVELEAIKAKLSAKSENEDKSAEEKHLEEFLVSYNDLQRQIDKSKRERDQQIQANLSYGKPA